MREYLFRGKRIDNNEWVYGYLVKGDRIGTTIMTGNYHVNSGSDAFENYEVIPETVGQIVGLKDKQNNNVFGDDILKFYYWSTYEQRSFPEYVDFRETDMKEALFIGMILNYHGM